MIAVQYANRFRLFPTTGFQIITESSSHEDSPCSKGQFILQTKPILARNPVLASPFQSMPRAAKNGFWPAMCGLGGARFGHHQ
jgi:hypothetical protein